MAAEVAMLLCVSSHQPGTHHQSVQAVSLTQQQGAEQGGHPKLLLALLAKQHMNRKVGC